MISGRATSTHMEGNMGSRSLLQAARKILEAMMHGQWGYQLQQGSRGICCRQGSGQQRGPAAIGTHLPQQQGPQQPVCEKL